MTGGPDSLRVWLGATGTSLRSRSSVETSPLTRPKRGPHLPAHVCVTTHVVDDLCGDTQRGTGRSTEPDPEQDQAEPHRSELFQPQPGSEPY